jgi:hypothetical protein
LPDELIVVAAHGNDWFQQCVDSLGSADSNVTWSDGGYSTGSYLRAYLTHLAVDRFLFIQDSMTCVVDDPLAWFRDQWTEGAVVAWQRFNMQWDDPAQQKAVEDRYPGVSPTHGIFGPVFYVERKTLQILDDKGLLPAVPTTRLEAQGAERAWAYAFESAGIAVLGPEWSAKELVAGEPVGPFRKVFAGRP